jgi:hypothetical protein
MIIKEEELERLNQVCVCVYMYPRGNPSTSNAWRSLVSTTASTTPQQQTLFQLRAFLFFSSKTFEK